MNGPTKGERGHVMSAAGEFQGVFEGFRLQKTDGFDIRIVGQRFNVQEIACSAQPVLDDSCAALILVLYLIRRCREGANIKVCPQPTWFLRSLQMIRWSLRYVPQRRIRYRLKEVSSRHISLSPVSQLRNSRMHHTLRKFHPTR